jgi:hypothetical protein
MRRDGPERLDEKNRRRGRVSVTTGFCPSLGPV